MFKLADTCRFKWPVTIRKPSSAEAGQIEEQSFVGLFRALPRTEAAALAEEMRRADTPETIAAAELHQIASVLEGWEDVVDDVGAPVAFGEEVLAAACEWPWFREATARAYAEGISGARLGN